MTGVARTIDLGLLVVLAFFLWALDSVGRALEKAFGVS